MKKIGTCNVRGQRYRVAWEHPTKAVGTCDPKNHVIQIKPNLGDDELLDTVIHELLHACYPDMGEDAIAESSRTITDALWRIGYRLEDDIE